MMQKIVSGTLLSLSAIVFLLTSPIPALAQAEGCNLNCGANMICAYEGNTPKCIPAAQGGTVDEIVVTGPAHSGLSLKNLVNNNIVPLGNTVLGVLFAFAFFFFIFGVFRFYFLKGGDAKARAEGRMFILWGLIGLVVLFSVWGLVNFTINLLPA